MPLLRFSRYGLICAVALAAAVTVGTLVSWVPHTIDALASGDVSEVVAGTDFRMFYAAADLASRDAWTDVYSLEGLATEMDATLGVVSFAYPPPFAQLLIPLANLSYPRALTAWMLISLLSVALVPAVLGRAGAWALAAISFPAYIMIRFGQFGPLALLALIGAAAAFKRGSPRLAGVSSGLLILKPQLLAGGAVLGVWLPGLRRRFAPGLGVVVFVILAASLALAPSAWTEWLSGFTEVASPPVTTPWDFSLRALTAPLGAIGSVVVQVVLAVAVFYLGIAASRRLDTHPEILAVGLIISALISPRMVAYDWVVLIPAFAWLTDRIWRDPGLVIAATAVTLGSLSGLVHLGWLAWPSLFGFLVVLWLETARPRADFRVRSAP